MPGLKLLLDTHILLAALINPKIVRTRGRELAR